MKRTIQWTLYWLLIAFALLAGLDNLIFQPVFPGLLIGIVTLVLIAYSLYRTRRYGL